MTDPSSDPPATGASSSRLLFDEGARAFPELELSQEKFAAYVSALGDADVALARAADLYLACACARRAHGAIEAFDRLYLSRVGVLLARMKPSAAFVDEVRQELRDKLFVGDARRAPKIAEYTGRGALLSWVRVIALRAAIDLRKRSEVAEDKGDRDAATTLDPELGYMKRRYRRQFNDAFRRAVAALSAEQCELLRLHFVDGLTLDELAVKLGVHRATIARRVAGGRRAVAEEARRLLRAELGASDTELESLVGVMRSQLDLSLPELLRAG